jgi:hypothetical protein
MARSKPSARRSRTSKLASSRTSMPGCARVKAGRRGISHSEASPGVVVSDSTSRCDGARISPTVVRNCASTEVQVASSRAPASVRTSARWRRRKRATPRSSSSARI